MCFQIFLDNCIPKSFMILRMLEEPEQFDDYKSKSELWKSYFSDFNISKSIECKNMRSNNQIQFIYRKLYKKDKHWNYIQAEVGLKVNRNSSRKSSTAVWTWLKHCCVPTCAKVIAVEAEIIENDQDEAIMHIYCIYCIIKFTQSEQTPRLNKSFTISLDTPPVLPFICSFTID